MGFGGIGWLGFPGPYICASVCTAVPAIMLASVAPANTRPAFVTATPIVAFAAFAAAAAAHAEMAVPTATWVTAEATE